MIIYKPSPLILDEDEPSRRLFSRKIEKNHEHLYDRKTFFFDAVRITSNKKHNDVSIFGPPLLNFCKNPGLPVINSNGDAVPYKIKTTALGRFSEWTIDSKTIDNHKNTTLDFRFKGISDRSIRLNTAEPFPEGTRILTAIQKNNKIHWIIDWFKHYENRFGVEYLVLYDNGSDDFQALRKALPDKTILVDWRFPYGPTLSHDNKFAQIGALNHCRRVFGRHSIIFNFDIDELLVINPKKASSLWEGKNVVYFSSFNVPHHEGLPENFSFNSYTMRDSRPKYFARKYIYRASASTGVFPHYVQNQKFRPIAVLVLLLRKLRNKVIRKTRNPKVPQARILSLIIRILTNYRKEPSVSVDTAYFLHFLGITTNWKSQSYRKAGNYLSDVIEDPFLKELREELS